MSSVCHGTTDALVRIMTDETRKRILRMVRQCAKSATIAAIVGVSVDKIMENIA